MNGKKLMFISMGDPQNFILKPISNKHPHHFSVSLHGALPESWTNDS
jgi:hypothetical protein